MSISGVLLYCFKRMTVACTSATSPEGLQPTRYIKNTWMLLLCTFTLSVIYLPLSTMAVHVLVWSDDLWAVPNPYTNATTFPPDVPPLGPSDEYRDPLDFCYTTTMLRNEVNYAPAVFIIAFLCVLAVSQCRYRGPPIAHVYTAHHLVPCSTLPDDPSCHTKGRSLHGIGQITRPA